MWLTATGGCVTLHRWSRIGAGAALGDESLARVAAVADSLPLVAGMPRFGAPVGGVGKVIVIGLNYRAHAAEAGLAAPSDPIVILVSPTAICGG